VVSTSGPSSAIHIYDLSRGNWLYSFAPKESVPGGGGAVLSFLDPVLAIYGDRSVTLLDLGALEARLGAWDGPGGGLKHLGNEGPEMGAIVTLNPSVLAPAAGHDASLTSMPWLRPKEGGISPNAVACGAYPRKAGTSGSVILWEHPILAWSVGQEVKIQRSDGRIHLAKVVGRNLIKRRYRVRWGGEEGEFQRDVDAQIIEALNPRFEPRLLLPLPEGTPDPSNVSVVCVDRERLVIGCLDGTFCFLDYAAE
jgi:hypothetical protein